MKILNYHDAFVGEKGSIYYDNRIFPIAITEGENRDYRGYNRNSKKAMQDLSKINDLMNTTLVKNTYTKENTEEEIVGLKDIAVKHSDYKKLTLYNSAFTNEILFTKAKFDRTIAVKTVPFKVRDLDIKGALLRGSVSPIIAEALICGRDHSDIKSGKDSSCKGTLLEVSSIESDAYSANSKIVNLENIVVKLYKHFKIPKKQQGEFRDIYEPIEDFKVIMQNLNRVLQATFNSKTVSNQFAYIKNRNIVNNAEVHKNNKTIVKIDISKFFESIKFDYIKKYIGFLCKDENLLNEFKLYITNPDTKGLYMGNPISGTLSNILMHKVTKLLEHVFEKRDMAVSVYSDDITVSSNGNISKEMVVSIVKYAFEKFKLDFVVNLSKTKKLSKQNRRICGVSINGNDTITVQRDHYEMSRVMLYRLSKGKDITIPMTTFLGRLSFYKYVDQSGKFQKLFEKYEDTLNKIGFKINVIPEEFAIQD